MGSEHVAVMNEGMNFEDEGKSNASKDEVVLGDKKVQIDHNSIAMNLVKKVLQLGGVWKLSHGFREVDVEGGIYEQGDRDEDHWHCVVLGEVVVVGGDIEEEHQDAEEDGGVECDCLECVEE